jgi:Holliday junction resolvasome RuvABC endonuclease subunit
MTEYQTILALDLGTSTGWAIRVHDGSITSGTVSFKPGRFEGGGMRYLRFKHWLTETKNAVEGIGAVYFEEVRRHAGVDAAHAYGGFLAHLTAWCEHHAIPYEGVPVGTIKKFATGKGNTNKQAMVTAIVAKGFQPQDDNEADALALLLWAIPQHTGGK